MSSRGSVVHHPSSSSYYGPNAIKTPHSPRRGSLARASHQSAGEVAQASGISLETWNRLYVALAQYAHSSPFAVDAAANFDPNSSTALGNLNMITRWAGGMLAKMLVDMAVLIPGSDARWTEAHRRAVLVHSEVVERLWRE